MKLLKKASAAALGLVGAAGAMGVTGGVSTVAYAQSSPLVSNPRGVIRAFDLANLENIVGELGGEIVGRQTMDSGNQVMGAKFGGLTIVLAPRACDGENQTQCRGLVMEALFRDRVPLSVANNYNSNEFSTKAVVIDDGRAFTQRYLIADYGMSRGTLAVNIAVFAMATDNFIKLIRQGATANQISFRIGATTGEAPRNVPPGKPMPGDNLADDLNARQKIANERTQPETSAYSSFGHSVAAEETTPVSVIAVGEKLQPAFYNTVN